MGMSMSGSMGRNRSRGMRMRTSRLMHRSMSRRTSMSTRGSRRRVVYSRGMSMRGDNTRRGGMSARRVGVEYA